MVRDIWNSFVELPMWVRIWVVAILIPVNLAPLFFLDEPMGATIAALAFLGMLPNMAIMMAERAITKTMSLPHVVFWVPLVIVVLFVLTSYPDLSPAYFRFLIVLLVIDLISLGFDINDSVAWFRQRAAK